MINIEQMLYVARDFNRKLVKFMWIAYAIMWISISLAVCFGMYITKSAWCLWAFLIPTWIKMSHKYNNENVDTNEDNKEDKE